MIRVLLVVVFLSFCGAWVSAQAAPDFQLAQNLFVPKQPHKPHYSQLAKSASTNELKALFSGLFLFYKKFISSQDKPSCAFSPSCSVYAMQSIKTNGLLIGSIDAFDRLARCNPLVTRHYKLDEHSHKFFDPVNSQK